MGGSELAILDWIQSSLRCGALDVAMVAVTMLGDLGLVWICAGAFLVAHPGSRRTGIVMLAALAVAFVASQLVLKSLVMRPRPCDVVAGFELLVSRPRGSSFPSAHSATAFACATVLCIRHARGWPAAMALAVLIAVSRLYLYVHYPTDVLAGVCVGVIAGVVANLVANRAFARREASKED